MTPISLLILSWSLAKSNDSEWEIKGHSNKPEKKKKNHNLFNVYNILKFGIQRDIICNYTTKELEVITIGKYLHTEKWNLYLKITSKKKTDFSIFFN